METTPQPKLYHFADVELWLCQSYFPFAVEIKEYVASFDELRKELRELVCLRCRKRARVKIHELVSRYCGAETIRVARVKCTECGKTFRVLPEFVVPYKSHSAKMVGKAISVCQQKGSKYGAAKTVGVAVRLVRRWVKWWQIVEAVIKASGLKQINYEEGWLEQVLRIFRNWKRATLCET